MTKKEQILKLRDEGYSYREIQKIAECSRGTIAYHCGPGQKLKSLNRQQDRRKKVAQFIQEHKTKNCICNDCKESYPYWMLEFDHLDNKSFAVSQWRQHTLDIEKVKEEIEKCEILCANCHRNRTFTRIIKSGNSIDIDLINNKWEE